MNFLSAINNEPIFTPLGLSEDTIIVGPSSTLESIYLIQMISFAENFYDIDTSDHDIQDF